MAKTERKETRHIDEHSYASEGNDFTYDPLVFMFHNGKQMVQNARTWSEKSLSYRKVKVGTVLLADNPVERRLRLYVGHNHSAIRGEPKYCAEMMATGNANKDGYVRRPAFFTAGPTNPKIVESIVHRPLRFLPPCSLCLPLLEETSLVFSVGNIEDVFAVHGGQEILRDLLYSPLDGTARSRRRKSDLSIPAFDLKRLDWRRAEDNYQQLSTEIKPADFDSLHDLRAARLARAIVALTADVPQAA